MKLLVEARFDSLEVDKVRHTVVRHGSEYEYMIRHQMFYSDDYLFGGLGSSSNQLLQSPSLQSVRQSGNNNNNYSNNNDNFYFVFCCCL